MQFTPRTEPKMMLHLISDAYKYGKNARFGHCFLEEDGMQWLKRGWCATIVYACVALLYVREMPKIGKMFLQRLCVRLWLS